MLRVTIVHREHEASLKSVFLTRKHTHTHKLVLRPGILATRPTRLHGHVHGGRKEPPRRNTVWLAVPTRLVSLATGASFSVRMPKSHFVSISSSA